MKNVELSLDGNILTIRVDLTQVIFWPRFRLIGFSKHCTLKFDEGGRKIIHPWSRLKAYQPRKTSAETLRAPGVLKLRERSVNMWKEKGN